MAESNKGSLAMHISKNFDISKEKSRAIVDSLFNAIEVQLDLGMKIDIAGFGKFEVAERAARKGRNPATGEAIEIPAKRAVTFKPAKALKDSINNHQ